MKQAMKWFTSPHQDEGINLWYAITRSMLLYLGGFILLLIGWHVQQSPVSGLAFLCWLPGYLAAVLSSFPLFFWLLVTITPGFIHRWLDRASVLAQLTLLLTLVPLGLAIYGVLASYNVGATKLGLTAFAQSRMLPQMPIQRPITSRADRKKQEGLRLQLVARAMVNDKLRGVSVLQASAAITPLLEDADPFVVHEAADALLLLDHRNSILDLTKAAANWRSNELFSKLIEPCDWEAFMLRHIESVATKNRDPSFSDYVRQRQTQYQDREVRRLILIKQLVRQSVQSQADTNHRATSQERQLGEDRTPVKPGSPASLLEHYRGQRLPAAKSDMHWTPSGAGTAARTIEHEREEWAKEIARRPLDQLREVLRTGKLAERDAAESDLRKRAGSKLSVGRGVDGRTSPGAAGSGETLDDDPPAKPKGLLRYPHLLDAQDAREDALYAIAQLGPKATPAMPELLTLFQQKTYSPTVAIVFAAIGPGAEAAVEPLTKSLRSTGEPIAHPPGPETVQTPDEAVSAWLSYEEANFLNERLRDRVIRALGAIGSGNQ